MLGACRRGTVRRTLGAGGARARVDGVRPPYHGVTTGSTSRVVGIDEVAARRTPDHGDTRTTMRTRVLLGAMSPETGVGMIRDHRQVRPRRCATARRRRAS